MTKKQTMQPPRSLHPPLREINIPPPMNIAVAMMPFAVDKAPSGAASVNPQSATRPVTNSSRGSGTGLGSASLPVARVYARQTAHLVSSTVRFTNNLPQPLDEPPRCHSEVHKDVLLGRAPIWGPPVCELDEAFRLGVRMFACAVG